DPHQAW
ncbi:oxaloacetate decarboxylase alpha subunit, partial [Vibrio parahaemolyticus EKP-008]